MGGAAAPGQFAAPPENYLGYAILVTLFCFPFTGIAAIVFSSLVNSAYNMGDMAGAMYNAAEARKYCKISVIIWLVLWGGILLYLATVAIYMVVMLFMVAG